MLPYAGNDANYPTAVNIIDGSSSPSSANFQTGYEGTLDRSAYQQNRGGLAPLVALQTAFTTQSFASFSNAAGPHAVCFNDTPFATDPTAGQHWLFAVWDTGHTHIQVFAGYGDNTDAWSQVGGNISYTSTATSLCVDSSGNIYVAGVGGLSATEADIYKAAPLGSFSSFLVISGITGASDLQIATLGTNLFYAVGSTTSGQAQISGGFGGGFTGLTPSQWIVRSSPTMVLFIPAVATVGATAYKATGTATFTSASIGLASTDIPQDLTWSAAWNLWFLVVKTGTGGTTLWSSPDGASWTLAKSMTTLPKATVGMVAIGPHLIGVLDAPNSGNLSRVITSSDGGVTWYAVDTGLLTGSATGPQNKPVAGPNRIFYGQTSARNSTGAQNVRFSLPMGRGDQAIT